MAEKKPLPIMKPEPWERQESESAQAFQGFALYRDMGAGRSLAKVAQELGKSKALMERWSVRWQWGQRAEAWDEELDRQLRRELTKGVVEMRKNHADIARAMLSKSLEALQRIPIEKMGPKDIATMVDVASKLERISRGEATERTEGKQVVTGEVSVQKINLSSLSDDELSDLERLLDKLDAPPQ